MFSCVVLISWWRKEDFSILSLFYSTRNTSYAAILPAQEASGNDQSKHENGRGHSGIGLPSSNAPLVWARVKEAKINPTTLWIIDICDYIIRYIYIRIHKLTAFANRKDYPIIYFDGEHERKPPILGFSNSLFFSRLPFALSYHPCSLDQCTKSEFAPWCWWWIPNIKKHAGMLPQIWPSRGKP